jgi:hypothetical protein
MLWALVVPVIAVRGRIRRCRNPEAPLVELVAGGGQRLHDERTDLGGQSPPDDDLPSSA